VIAIVVIIAAAVAIGGYYSGTRRGGGGDGWRGEGRGGENRPAASFCRALKKSSTASRLGHMIFPSSLTI